MNCAFLIALGREKTVLFNSLPGSEEVCVWQVHLIDVERAPAVRSHWPPQPYGSLYASASPN
jgi:hypothetical protein